MHRISAGEPSTRGIDLVLDDTTLFEHHLAPFLTVRDQMALGRVSRQAAAGVRNGLCCAALLNRIPGIILATDFAASVVIAGSLPPRHRPGALRALVGQIPGLAAVVPDPGLAAMQQALRAGAEDLSYHRAGLITQVLTEGAYAFLPEADMLRGFTDLFAAMRRLNDADRHAAYADLPDALCRLPEQDQITATELVLQTAEQDDTGRELLLRMVGRAAPTLLPLPRQAACLGVIAAADLHALPMPLLGLGPALQETASQSQHHALLTVLLPCASKPAFSAVRDALLEMARETLVNHDPDYVRTVEAWLRTA